MKYLFYKDIFYFFRKYLRIFAVYIAIIILFLILQTKIGVPLSEDLFFDTLGINCSLNDSFLVILMYLFNVGCFILLAILLVKDDITNYTSNIFLRKGVIWWFFNKIISVSMIIFLLKMILYILCYMFFLINNYNMNGIMNFMVHDYMYILLIIMLVFLIYFLYNKSKLLTFVFIIIILFFCKLPINILNSNLIIVIMLLVGIILVLFAILRKSRVSFLEK